MADSYMVITEKDWGKASENQRAWMMFNTVQNMNERLRKLEGKGIINKSLTVIGGIIGGALAYVGLKSLS